MPRPLARVLAVVTLLGAPILLFGERLLSLYVDYLWFSALGYQAVFATGLWARLLSFALGVAVAMAIFLPNLWLARSIARRTLLRVPTRLVYQPPDPARRLGAAGPEDPGLERPRPIADLLETMGGAAAGRSFVLRLGTAPLVGSALAVALVMGLTSGGQWESFLRAMQAVPFATNDPVFGRDVAFYVFVLPALRFVQEWLAWAVLLSILMVGGLYLVALYGLDPTFAVGWLHLQRRALGMRSHVMGLLALLLGVFGAGIWLSTFDLLVARHPRMVGANFTDLHARLPATQALAATVALTALLLLVAIFRRSYSLPLVGGVLVAVVLVLGRGALPVLVQRLQVEPAEVSQERPYLATNITFTRQAFGLVDVAEETFPAEEAVRVEDMRHNPATIANIRLWDHRPLRDAYNQLQSIRSYYAFDDVDIDRYVIDGQYRQVMLSARELAPERLGAQAQTWVNRRLQYTHGYGVVMSPVNEVSAEGPPTFFLQDVPPQGKLRVDRPEIYYGEQTSGYVIVNTAVQEFDYPRGDQNAFTTYAGHGGVTLGPWWRRAALALYFADFNLLVSSYLQPESQILFRRQITERVRHLAPYLKYDGDPYLVVENGRLYWLVDAYTITDQYPYSQLVQDQRLSAPRSATGQGTAGVTSGFTPAAPLRRHTYNYIRNSVKVVMDAYDGTVTFYLADPSDPIIRTYAAIFPELYRPLSAMPAELRRHLRYPEDLFQAQAQILRAYHVQDPQVFYNGEDVWATPVEAVGGQRAPVDPYYVIMRLPGQTEAEFLLMLPFTPAGRPNMIGWLAARSDGDRYGKLALYKFPKDRLIYGPAQLDSRIDQDTEIAAQFTLWNQLGSRVIRGNLLVIPIGSSTLYVEPIYLQAESSPLPEFKRVVVATGNRLVMESTLEAGLLRLFGAETGITPPPPPGGSAEPASATLAATAAREARAAYQRALEALRAGDFARFGEELRSLDERLRELELAAGS